MSRALELTANALTGFQHGCVKVYGVACRRLAPSPCVSRREAGQRCTLGCRVLGQLAAESLKNARLGPLPNLPLSTAAGALPCRYSPTRVPILAPSASAIRAKAEVEPGLRPRSISDR